MEIQEEIVGELARAEESGFGVLEEVAKYYLARAKLTSKVIKYPYMKDYQQALLEIDEKEYINLKVIFLDLRNNYAILVCGWRGKKVVVGAKGEAKDFNQCLFLSTQYDLLTKNIEKIRNPRSNQHMQTMY